MCNNLTDHQVCAIHPYSVHASIYPLTHPGTYHFGSYEFAHFCSNSTFSVLCTIDIRFVVRWDVQAHVVSKPWHYGTRTHVLRIQLLIRWHISSDCTCRPATRCVEECEQGLGGWPVLPCQECSRPSTCYWVSQMKQWDGSAGVPPVELFGHLSAYYEVMELFVKWFLCVSHLTQ